MLVLLGAAHFIERFNVSDGNELIMSVAWLSDNS